MEQRYGRKRTLTGHRVQNKFAPSPLLLLQGRSLLICPIYLRVMKTFAPRDALASPSVARNQDPILAVLRRVLAPAARVLEIASGTGEHAVYFAAALPHLTWQPSDQDEQALKSIAAHWALSGLPNL